MTRSFDQLIIRGQADVVGFHFGDLQLALRKKLFDVMERGVSAGLEVV